MTAPNEQKKAVETYRKLLVEIRFRIDVVNAALDGRTGLAPRLVEELAYLQFRMICEVIAIGCLVLHGDLKPSQTLMKSWKADWLMTKLSNLHSDFFPVSLESTDTVHGEILSDLRQRESGYLTMNEVQTLWRESGKILHRGGAKAVIKENEVLGTINPPRITQWLSKIVALLSRHMVVTRDGKSIHIFVMRDPLNRVASQTLEPVTDPREIDDLAQKLGRPLVDQLLARSREGSHPSG